MIAPQGPAGTNGAQGLIGPTGPQGLVGPQGVAGPTGPTGAAPTVTVAATNTGAPGTQASVTSADTGTGVALTFTIPQGPTGPQGLAGAAGAAGPAGPTGPTNTRNSAMLAANTLQTVAANNTVTFETFEIYPPTGSDIAISGTNGVTLTAAGQYLAIFVSDAGVAAADDAITAALQLDGTPIVAAETNLEQGGANIERITLNAIITTTGGQVLTVVNNGADENTHENAVLTVVKLS